MSFDPVVIGISVLAFVFFGSFLASVILLSRKYLVDNRPCEIRINDNDDISFKAPGGTTLLNALLSQDIAVPSPCGGKATCKQCKVRVLEGGGPVLDVDKATFTQKQIDAGWKLSCQCKVKNDVKIHVEEEYLDVEEFEGEVVSNENVATFIKELVIKVKKKIDYRSGAYLQFHVPPYNTNTTDWKKTMDKQYYPDWEHFKMFDIQVDQSGLSGDDIRAYSMASHPNETLLLFNIRIATPPFEGNEPSKKIPWGLCSTYTFSLKKGDKVRLSGPYGESYMINDDREVIFLIGGAGSSFGRAHILHLFDVEKTKRKVSMWYGARSLKENIYEKEYKDLDKKHKNFEYNLVLSNPLKEDIDAGWPTDDPVKTNFVFKAFEIGKLSKMEEPEEALFYVCGPPMHNQSVMELLDNYGVPRSSIILDDFGS